MAVANAPRAQSPVLAAKLRPAANLSRLVRRPRLFSLLDDSREAPMTLVVAPAGSGKTSLLAGWVAESPTRTAWLSLDEADRDPVSLWTGMTTALEQLVPGCGARARSTLGKPGAVLEAVSVLLDDLESDHAPAATLVVDDLHAVDGDSASMSSLALFLQHLPAYLRVVVLARRLPQLPVERLSGRGQLVEIRFAELKFSAAEAAELLGALNPALEPALVEAAVERAGGWAASLRLEALAARSGQAQVPPATPASDDGHLIGDYVWREVLVSERPELVEALLDTAVVERVDPGLARALTCSSEAESLLDEAEGRGLFVTRSHPAGTYEIHSQVRKVLVAELARRSPARLDRQHRRAAEWFEEHGHVTLALEHWLLGDRPREALRLLAAQHAALHESGQEATLRRTLSAIPQSVISSDLDSAIDFAWANVLVNRQRFLDLTDGIARWTDDTPGLDPAVRGRATILRSLSQTLRGDWEAGADGARNAASDLGAPWWFDPLGRAGWNTVADEIALSERWDDTGPEVREVRQALGVDPGRRPMLEGTRALGEALAGRPVDALRVGAGVRESANLTNLPGLQAQLAVAEAVARREVGEVARAVSQLVAIAESPPSTPPHCRVLALLELTQARLDQGDLAAARLTFGQATEYVDAEFAGRGGRSWLARTGTMVALASQDLAAARSWADQVDDPFWYGVSSARVHLAEDHRAEAATALSLATPRCPRHVVVRELVRAQLVEDQEEALKCVISAIERSVSVGLLQTVASEGPAVTALVELAAWRTPRPWLDRLRRAGSPGLGPAAGRVPDSIETLTDRELQVLRLLPSRLTLREIAAELYITMNTLKFHLKVIYRKLGCASRAEAAEIARAMARLGGSGPSAPTSRR